MCWSIVIGDSRSVHPSTPCRIPAAFRALFLCRSLVTPAAGGYDME